MSLPLPFLVLSGNSSCKCTDRTQPYWIQEMLCTLKPAPVGTLGFFYHETGLIMIHGVLFPRHFVLTIGERSCLFGGDSWPPRGKGRALVVLDNFGHEQRHSG